MRVKDRILLLICYDGNNMLINTRNFFLYILCVGFLVIAIVATYTKDVSSENKQIDMYVDSETEESEYKVATSTRERVSREQNLEALRQKIAVINKDQVISPASETEEVATEEENPTTTELGSVMQCENYQADKAFFLPSDIKIMVAEGARLVYRDLPIAPVSASSSVATPDNRELLLQLPLRSFPMAVKNCLPYEIVGIAPDGSMIRNNEASVYAIFGPDTLVGYALDGFAIYGKSNSQGLDSCGGEVVGGEYRYYLSDGRDKVLNCFAGTPIQI
jgi:hypothetical protein